MYLNLNTNYIICVHIIVIQIIFTGERDNYILHYVYYYTITFGKSFCVMTLLFAEPAVNAGADLDKNFFNSLS